MREIGRQTAGKGLLLLLLLAYPTTAASAAQCNNPIVVLGGSTAIWRGSEIDTVAELQDVVVNKKTQAAFREILEKADLKDRYEEVMQIIGSMTEKDLRPIPKGTQFEWMAYRRRSDKHIGLLYKACWEGKSETKGWYFNLVVGPDTRTYVIPASCLNLSLLNRPPLDCRLTASARCSENSAPTKITIKAEPWARGRAWIDKVELEGVFQGEPITLDNPSRTARPFEWSLDATKAGTYSFTAKVTATERGGHELSATCRDEVTVCKPTGQPACELTATANCSKGSTPTKVKITATPKEKGEQTITLSGVFEKDGASEPIAIANSSVTGHSFNWSVDADKSGTYSFTAQVKGNEGEKCSTAVAVCDSSACKPPSCKLSVTPTDNSLSISIAGTEADSVTLMLNH